MKRQIKLTSEAEHALQQSQQTEQATMIEFASPEEMLRHDVIHTPVPPAIAHRLQDSIEQLPPANKSWWRKWFE